VAQQPSAAEGLSLHLDATSLRRTGADGRTRTILDAVDLRVAAGEHLAIVGPSGAGKTSLLHLAACALRPDSGTIRLDGSDPWAAGPAERRRLRRALFLGPQVPPLPPRQRVVTAVLAGRLPAMGFWRSLRSLIHPDDLAAAQAALAPFGLEARLFDRVDRLSGGERQRVGLARALLAPARIWLLDEPLGALDPARATGVLQVLRAQAAQRGVTLVMAMHQVDLAQAHFPRLVGMREGRVAFDQAAASLAPAQWRALYAMQPDADADAGGGLRHA
jgi:phosphonate transport system ATP-binding protein